MTGLRSLWPIAYYNFMFYLIEFNIIVLVNSSSTQERCFNLSLNREIPNSESLLEVFQNFVAFHLAVRRA